MTAIAPYTALFFFGADDTSEVNREYEEFLNGDADGFRPLPDLAERVTVVAAEVDRGIERVWFIRSGRLENRDSWQLREYVP